MSKNISLIGFMGSGKSSVAKVLSEKLKRTIVSTDHIIEEREGASIVEIFQKKGEDYFRAIEKEVVKAIELNKNLIIDCGGGVVLDAENMAQLKKGGSVTYLQASPQFLYEQVKGRKHRPLLNVDDPLAKIAELLEARSSFYEQADYTVSSEDRSVEEIADEIITLTSPQ